MRVTPRVSPEGKVLMRVEPQVTTVTPTPVNLGNGATAPAFNVQSLQVTVLASDGESVVVRGLSASDGFCNPGDGPLAALVKAALGCQKGEVVIILTPHIVRSESANPGGYSVPLPQPAPAPRR